MRDRANTLAADMLTRDAEMDFIFALSDAMAKGVYSATKLAGATPMITGYNGDCETLNSVWQGRITATLYQGWRDIGAQVVRTTSEVAKGMAVDKVIIMPTFVVDRASMEQISAGSYEGRHAGARRRRGAGHRRLRLTDTDQPRTGAVPRTATVDSSGERPPHGLEPRVRRPPDFKAFRRDAGARRRHLRGRDGGDSRRSGRERRGEEHARQDHERPSPARRRPAGACGRGHARAHAEGGIRGRHRRGPPGALAAADPERGGEHPHQRPSTAGRPSRPARDGGEVEGASRAARRRHRSARHDRGPEPGAAPARRDRARPGSLRPGHPSRRAHVVAAPGRTSRAVRPAAPHPGTGRGHRLHHPSPGRGPGAVGSDHGPARRAQRRDPERGRDLGRTARRAHDRARDRDGVSGAGAPQAPKWRPCSPSRTSRAASACSTRRWTCGRARSSVSPGSSARGAPRC